MRLDKYLAEMGVGTRSQVKQYIRKCCVTVNGELVRQSDAQITPETDEICYNGQTVGYAAFEYYMLNKPAGVISASEDRKQETVIDLIDTRLRKDLFPVGRLDKDTEGLLLITNDGALTHQLLSPKKHVSKRYFARIDGKVTEREVKLFREGVAIDEDFTALPAELKILISDHVSEIEVVIYEGKFHQIKRMFEAVGMEVIYLKRLSMGSLLLDERLGLGEYRPLTEEELAGLRAHR